MMQLGTSRHQRALSAATVFVRLCNAEFTRGADTATLTPASGTLTQDARRAMIWSGEITLELENDSPLIPLSPTDLLSPFGTTVDIELGVRLADDTEEVVPYGSYVVNSTSVNMEAGKRSVRLSLADRAISLAGYRFEVPVIVASGDVADVVNAVVLDRLGYDPGLAATGETVGSSVFGLDAQTDPWAELQSVAASRGLRLRYSRAGVLTLDAAPDYLNDIPFEIDRFLSVSASFESRPPNVISARGEPSDGTAPSLGIAMDDDPASPTYAGATVGSTPYGRITQFYASKFLTSDAMALGAAEAMLARKVGAGASWSVVQTFDPTLDVDDLVSVPSVPQVPPLAVDAVTLDIVGTTGIAGRAVSI